MKKHKQQGGELDKSRGQLSYPCDFDDHADFYGDIAKARKKNERQNSISCFCVYLVGLVVLLDILLY